VFKQEIFPDRKKQSAPFPFAS